MKGLLKDRRIWWLAAGAVAAAIAAGVSLSTVLLVGFLLLCPLAMAGMHGGGHSHDGSDRRASDGSTEGDPTAGQAGGSAPVHRH